MDSQAIPLPHHYQSIVDRFVDACEADARVVAAFLVGSYARGTADSYSDLDFYLLTTDAAYEEFVAGRAAFIRQLGELLFLEDFGSAITMFFIFSDGTECELSLGRASQFEHIFSGPYRVLLDKKGILAGAVFPWREPTPADQVETLRHLVAWFWHDLSHFITAMARGQLWWAHGQIEELRRYCVNLARLRESFSDPDVGSDSYFKLEQAVPAEQLSALQATFCPMEPGAMLEAARVIVRFYQELAPLLARIHGIPYPAELERVMYARLERVCDIPLS